MKSADTNPPLSAGAGITTDPANTTTDPKPAERFAQLFDLMVVVEELCPVWPQREPFREGGIWLL